MSEMIYEDVIRTKTLEMDRGERQDVMHIYESADSVINDEVMINTEMMSTERQQELQHTGRVSVKNRRHRSVQGCLCLLSVLLFTAVIVICVYFTNERNQLLTHNYNLTKENEKCSSLILNQSRILTEEREKFRNNSDELQAANQEKKLLLNNLTKERDELPTNNSKLLNKKKLCQMQITSMSEESDKKTEADDLKRWLTEQDQRSDNFKWIYYNFSFYYISSDQKIWSDSKRDCEQRGANLLIINNKEEQEFLQKATTAGYNYWIGLSKEGGVWKWVDGTTLTLSFWKNEYPGSSYNHSCTSADTSGWTDYQCNSIYRWICEKSIFKTPGQTSA